MADELYNRLAHLWPLLSPPSDYLPEAERVRDVLARIGGIVGSDDTSDVNAPSPSVLELGVGGGHTLVHLADGFKCTGVDISNAMLANARKLVPGREFIAGDMRSIRLGRTFDAVLIHDAIDHMATLEDAANTLKTAAAHLGPEGLAIVAPTYVQETFTDHAIAQDANSDGEIEVAYLSTVSRPSPDANTFEHVMLIMAKENNELSVTEDRGQCGLFSRDQWCKMFDDAGFDIYIDEGEMPEKDDDQQLPDEAADGGAIPWFIGIKRSAD